MRKHDQLYGKMPLARYLALEERSPLRHEYIAGAAYAMSGATFRHGRIGGNIAAHLRNAARARRCAIVLSEVKVRVADRIYYPDLVLACGHATDVDLIVEEPSLLVEVTSPSTRATDRREKLDAYQRIPSLQAYLIVEQRRRHVLAYVRNTTGEWICEETQGAGDVAIPFLDLRLSLDKIYEDITLPPLTVREGEEWRDQWAMGELVEDDAESP